MSILPGFATINVTEALKAHQTPTNFIPPHSFSAYVSWLIERGASGGVVREDVGQIPLPAQQTREKADTALKKRAKNNRHPAVSQISGSGLIFLTFFILVAVIFVDSRLARLAKVQREALEELKLMHQHLAAMRRYYEPQEPLPPPLSLEADSQPGRESLRHSWK
jgi:hypothetical protein